MRFFSFQRQRMRNKRSTVVIAGHYITSVVILILNLYYIHPQNLTNVRGFSQLEFLMFARLRPLHPPASPFPSKRGRLVEHLTVSQVRQVYLYSKLDDLLSHIDEEVENISVVTKIDNSDVVAKTTNDNHKWIKEITSSCDSQKERLAMPPSPVEILNVRNRTIYIKKDDELVLSGSGINGNKGRKMWHLNNIPSKNFPNLVSFGGPQSNAMLALAAIVNYKNREVVSSRSNTHKDGELLPIKFVYYTKKLPRFLRNQPSGNLFRALTLGMQLKELTHKEYDNLFKYYQSKNGQPPIGLTPTYRNSFFVPQGASFSWSLDGVRMLAKEIFTYWLENGNNRPLTICVPGGTCTTALCLHHGLRQLMLESDNLGDFNNGYTSNDQDGSGDSHSTASMMDIEVVVIPCVGDASYARKQMMSLSTQIGENTDDIPTILQPEPEERENQTKKSMRSKKYFQFGKPEREILQVFQELENDSNLVVDLLYGAPSFAVMLRHWGRDGASTVDNSLSFDPNFPLSGDREIMYVHSGGLEGINSQLLRYQHVGLLKIKDIQLPGRRKK